MKHHYEGVITRFLRADERLMASDASELPLVIEALESKSVDFLQNFLARFSSEIKADVAQYGAVLFRGFEVTNEHHFEDSLLSLNFFKGISDALMSEEGRVPVGDLNYVLHTNAIYKTGGTLYLGGFHSENYYSPDVPNYIGFCCLKPSLMGGETGLVHMQKIYEHLNPKLKQRLEERSFFVSTWRVHQVASRYGVSLETVEKIAKQFGLPLVGKDDDAWMVMCKPNVCMHQDTQKKALMINLFEIKSLNRVMRRFFINDYQGSAWFWHRLVWRMPDWVFKLLEWVYVGCASFFYSPKEALRMMMLRLSNHYLWRKQQPSVDDTKVGQCFDDADVTAFAGLIRQYYSSCLWQKGDIILVDNTQVMHAGMPGKGPRTIRAMIGNPLEMTYGRSQSGCITARARETESIGVHIKHDEVRS